jgi:sec-independent protein translocase protein TatB
MFDIGFSELLVIAVVALLVLGPERLPKAARFAGLWVRKARAQWYSVKSEFERDIAAEELQRSLRETRDSLRAAQEQLRTGAASIATQLEQDFNGDAAEPDRSSDARALPASPDSPDASESPDAPQQHAEPDDDDQRPMASTLEMDDLEPPPPDDADEDDASSPPHPDDAHAGR